MATRKSISAPAAPQGSRFDVLHMDLIGSRFGRLVIQSFTRVGNRPAYVCLCDCGNTATVTKSHLVFDTKQPTRSCGCIQSEVCASKLRTHGMSKLPEYKVWKGMKNRCFNKNEPHYEDYGGRGITVCERWRDSFPDFLADMGPRPSNRHELDRHPNNDGNYEPGNCRWAIRKQQARNRRSNRFVTIGGVAKTLAEWSELSGLSIGTISRRVELGWPEDRWLIPPTRKVHNKCKA